MLIDWFTVGAQVVNFLILVWLLKRFLYKPVLNAISAREKLIAAELADADAKRAGAQKERDDFEGKNRKFDEERSALLGKASDGAKAERERLIGEARKEADDLRAGQKVAIENDRLRLGNEITRLVTAEVFEIARKALADLATVSLEERVVEVFTRRLREMDAKDKDALAAAIRTSSEPAVVRSTFDLGAVQRAAVQNAVNEDFSAAVRLRFEIAPDGISGIELKANGQKVAWTIAGYISSLETNAVGLLNAGSAPTESPQHADVEPPALRSVA